MGFPRGQGDETTVGILAGEVGGSQLSDWRPWDGGESCGEAGEPRG